MYDGTYHKTGKMDAPDFPLNFDPSTECQLVGGKDDADIYRLNTRSPRHLFLVSEEGTLRFGLARLHLVAFETMLQDMTKHLRWRPRV